MASSSSSSPSPVQEAQQQDRLGALPDSILLHILSFLPTLDAVRTSVLSTRWRTLWTSVGALDLDEDNEFFYFGTAKRIKGERRKRKSTSGFGEFVGKVLSRHHAPTLHKLRLSCFSQNCPLIKDWLRTAFSRSVLTLDLCLPRHPDADGRAAQLPSLLFASQTLVELRLDLGDYTLILPGTLALVGLRHMRLCRVKFCDDHSTRALFSNSTALRSLTLKYCGYQKLGCLEISCYSLRELTIEDNSLAKDGLGSCQVKIDAPHLTSFVYLAPVAQAYIVEPLICVEYVKIQFQRFEWQKELDKPSVLDQASSFLCSPSSAKNLDICPVCVEVLRRYKGVPFPNLNVLKTAVKQLDYSALCVVLRLLLSNPQLRALVVQVECLYLLASLAEKEDFLELLGDCFEIRNGVLERVEIRCSDYASPGSTEVIKYNTETVLELVRVLLGSQTRLKKLILSTELFCDRYSRDWRRDAAMAKVLSLPKHTRLALAFI